jgi:hypothetical protein
MKRMNIVLWTLSWYTIIAEKLYSIIDVAKEAVHSINIYFRQHLNISLLVTSLTIFFVVTA